MNSQAVSRLVETLAKRSIKPLSINDIIFGSFSGVTDTDVGNQPRRPITCETLLKSAQWIHEELPVRLAHRIFDFNRLPYAVVSNPDIKRVYDLYVKTLTSTYKFPPITTREEEKAFTRELSTNIGQHRDVVRYMQQGVRTLGATYAHPDLQLELFLNCLFVTRIGNRLLAEHHCALHDDQGSELLNSDYVGIIDQRCKPVRIIDNVAKAAQQIAVSVYAKTPEIKIDGDTNWTFPYVPEHIRYVMLETLKNAVRATVEHNWEKDNLPAIRVNVRQGADHCCIHVEDCGGGIPLEMSDDIWHYGVTSLKLDNSTEYRSYGASQYRDLQRLVGYGFGLPLSRLYAEYFGGKFSLISQPGIGCSTYILLPCVGDQREPVDFLNNSTMRARNIAEIGQAKSSSLFSRNRSLNLLNP